MGKHRRFLSSSALVATAGVFIGVAAILIVLSVMNGFHSELQKRILGITPHIIVTRYSYEPIPNPDSLEKVIASHLGSHFSIAPFIYLKTLIKSETQSDGIIIRGIDPEKEKSITEIHKNIVTGEYRLSKSDILLGIDLARILGVTVGDEVTIVLPFSGELTPLGMIPKTKRVVIRGIFDAGLYEQNASLVYANLSDLQELLGMGKSVSGLEVKIKNIFNASRVARKLSQSLGYPYRALDWIALNRNLFTALRLEKVVTFIVLVLLIFVAAFNIIGILIMMVLRKTKEIGILKAMGTTPKSITRIFILAGFSIGIIGTVLGSSIGYLISALLNRYRFVQLPGDVYFIKDLPVKMEFSDFFLVILCALLISFLSTIYPAYKAARLTPVDAIRYE